MDISSMQRLGERGTMVDMSGQTLPDQPAGGAGTKETTVTTFAADVVTGSAAVPVLVHPESA